MGELQASFAPRFRRLLDRCEPFLVTARSNLGALELAPFELEIARRYDPTHTDSRALIDLLHVLDAQSFGGQSMAMPRWVMFDCGEFPGVVFGFGCLAQHLDDELREAYGLLGPLHDRRFVPLSMWIAIACAEPGAWFGHNLSSANAVTRDRSLSGLGTLTKVFGIAVTRGRLQYGATQWSSPALGLHVGLGQVELLGAWTPAHTHPATLVYRLPVERETLLERLRRGEQRSADAPVNIGDDWRSLEADDSAGMQRVHGELEAGARLRLAAVERPLHRPQRIWLAPLEAGQPS